VPVTSENTVSVFIFEAVATFLFLVCILGVAQEGSPSHPAGLAIGLTLTVIHIVGINVTGVSVNPRDRAGLPSLGPARMQRRWHRYGCSSAPPPGNSETMDGTVSSSLLG
jgi:glycerol uptake facilitator-like aquaporin